MESKEANTLQKLFQKTILQGRASAESLYCLLIVIIQYSYQSLTFQITDSSLKLGSLPITQS